MTCRTAADASHAAHHLDSRVLDLGYLPVHDETLQRRLNDDRKKGDDPCLHRVSRPSRRSDATPSSVSIGDKKRPEMKTIGPTRRLCTKQGSGDGRASLIAGDCG